METSQDSDLFQSPAASKQGLAHYAELLSQLENTNRESLAFSGSVVQRSKLSLRKLIISRRFANIDRAILDLNLSKAAKTGDFFSNVLLFEAQRLAFKEETLKCQSPKSPTQI